KRMPSAMSTWTVRVALAATPGLPIASPWPWPPGWVPVATAPVAVNAISAANAAWLPLFIMRFLWVRELGEGLSVAGVAAGGLADLDFDASGWHALAGHGSSAGAARRRWLGQLAIQFVGDGPLRVPEPARIRIVARLLAFAHFDDAEHAAHFDRADRAFAAHHPCGVVGQRHFHLGHVGHAALAHHHIVGDQLGDLLRHVLVVHADHGGHVVAHRIHRVMALVAVESPVALFVGYKLDLAHLADRHVGRHLVSARARRVRGAVGVSVLEPL